MATTMTSAEQVLAFADHIFRRADGQDEIVPKEHRPNWVDRPSRYRFYPKMPRIPLLSPSMLARSYAEHIAPANWTGGSPSLSQLSVLLYLALGPMRRKLDINWNADPSNINFTKQEFARGTASGGGLYPTQIYVASQPTRDLGAGVYHYATAYHALTPVKFGDWNRSIAHSAAHSSVHPIYLILTSDFWANCFKYHNFGYHVCSEDIGAVLATIQLVCDAFGIEQRTYLSFLDASANEVVGADGKSESVFAFVGLGPATGISDAKLLPAVTNATTRVPLHWQKSRSVNIPTRLAEIHQLTSLNECPLLPESMPVAVNNKASHQSVARTLRHSLPAILLARRSAWGSMRGSCPMQARTLTELLYFVESYLNKADIREPLPEASLQFYVRVNSVQGFEPGTYRYDPREGLLQPTPSVPLKVWQSTYSMENYNIDETGCILFIVGNLPRIVDLYGARGYRILNAYAGMAAQLTYASSAALGLDCGVVLGVRAQHVKSTLLLDQDQNVVLAIYLSKAQTRVELFNFNLLPDVTQWKPSN